MKLVTCHARDPRIRTETVNLDGVSVEADGRVGLHYERAGLPESLHLTQAEGYLIFVQLRPYWADSGAELVIGQRVELYPAGVRGARFGRVVKIGRKWVHVRLDATGRVVRVSPGNIGRVVG